VRLNHDGEVVAYAFVWPMGNGAYRLHVLPNSFDKSGVQPPTDGYCSQLTVDSCVFTSAGAVRRYYLEVLHPAFSTGHIPARYLEMTPWTGATLVEP
jgi:hypothetical protein